CLFKVEGSTSQVKVSLRDWDNANGTGAETRCLRHSSPCRIRIPRCSGGSECFEEVAPVHQTVSVGIRAALKPMIRGKHFLGADPTILICVAYNEQPVVPGLGRNP